MTSRYLYVIDKPADLSSWSGCVGSAIEFDRAVLFVDHVATEDLWFAFGQDDDSQGSSTRHGTECRPFAGRLAPEETGRGWRNGAKCHDFVSRSLPLYEN